MCVSGYSCLGFVIKDDEMMEMVRCPACRGAKKVAKLGGVIGKCNMCSGDGRIKAADKPKLAPVMEPVNSVDIIKQVADVTPVSVLDAVEVEVIADDVKIDPKKAIFKRKKSS